MHSDSCFRHMWRRLRIIRRGRGGKAALARGAGSVHGLVFFKFGIDRCAVKVAGSTVPCGSPSGGQSCQRNVRGADSPVRAIRSSIMVGRGAGTSNASTPSRW